MITLKPGREKPVRQQHPWVFSGAIRHIPDEFSDGDVVSVGDAKGNWLAQGYLNRQSQIQVRLLSWHSDEVVDDAFWQQRLTQAIAYRQGLPDLTSDTTAYRLVNGENDYLPGLIVDRYGEYLVLQAGTLGIDQRKRQIAVWLLALTGCRGVIERSDASVRKLEGLETDNSTNGLLAGDAPPATIPIQEHGLHFDVDLWSGQKTGFYTDQRTNRQEVARYCQGKTVLNTFSYTGAFAVHALAQGATHVTNIDSSEEVLTLSEANLTQNGLSIETQSEHVAGDIFTVLRDWPQLESMLTTWHPQFDVVILDPPKFAQRKNNVDKALRGYKDINLLALRLLKPGGLLATFSCSGMVSADLFQKVVFGAAHDAGRRLQIVQRFSQASDHPVAMTFPEGAYLKGLLCRVNS
ncbi:MAG: class I SAM-dependent rRNA methyltransferase [Chloroflexota bacterium]